MRTIFITGGAGFIGSAFVRVVLEETDYSIVNFDALTYAGNLENLAGINDDERYRFVRGDIAERRRRSRSRGHGRGTR
jgi:dTDP-glucose 4,6-dehydratase